MKNKKDTLKAVVVIIMGIVTGMLSAYLEMKYGQSILGLQITTIIYTAGFVALYGSFVFDWRLTRKEKKEDKES